MSGSNSGAVEDHRPAERVYLAVPYPEREGARKAGARWDAKQKAWFVSKGADLGAFAKWLDKDNLDLAADVSPFQACADELRGAGFRLVGEPVMDGSLQHVSVEGDRGREQKGWYVAHADYPPNVRYQNFRTMEAPTQKSLAGARRLDPRDRARIAAQAAENRREQEARLQRQYEAAAIEARRIWENASSDAWGHPYLIEKGVPASKTVRVARSGQNVEVETEHGELIRQDISGQLLIPAYGPDRKIRTIQRIRTTEPGKNRKRFLRNGQIGGSFHVIGKLDTPWPLILSEGYATGATIHDATGLTSVVCFAANNLIPVASTMREMFPNRAILIAGDNDHEKTREFDKHGIPKRNVGVEAALSAADLIGGQVLIPQFTERDVGCSDWNDAKRVRGREAVCLELTAGMRIADRHERTEELLRQRQKGHEQGQVRGRKEIAR